MLLSLPGLRRFRHTDGRWYHAQVLHADTAGVGLRFTRPTKAYMLESVVVSAGLVEPATAAAAHNLQWVQIGMTVLARRGRVRFSWLRNCLLYPADTLCLKIGQGRPAVGGGRGAGG